MTDTPIIAAIKKDWSWFLQHLILIGVLCGIALGSVYLVDGIIARHDAANLSQYQTILKNQELQTTALQNQLSAITAENAIRDAQYQKTLAQLTQNIVQRDANAQKQQKADSTLDASATAQRIAVQTNAAAGQVTVSDNNVVLDLPIARTVVSDLDALPVVQADLADTKKQLVAEQGLSDDATKALASAHGLIDSQTLQIQDANTSCKAQIAVVNANARKSKLKWFGVGFVIGFITGVSTHGF